jgi:hypothetical protein
MTCWLNLRSLPLPLVLLMVFQIGCRQLGLAFPEGPHAYGTWTGRLISVTVRENDGTRHDAAALQIESGPRVLRPDPGGGETYALKNEDAPYLTPAACGVQIADPGSFPIPIGARVRVNGKMINSPPVVRVYKAGYSAKVVETVYRVAGEPSGGALIIQMRGEPKVLEPNH